MHKATIIIPIFNLTGQRADNFKFILGKLAETDIPVIISEQASDNQMMTVVQSYFDIPKSNIRYVGVENNDKNLINKSKLINFASQIVETEYLWLVDADVYLKYEEVYDQITTQEVIKPFENVIRLDKQETEYFIANNKISFKKGQSKSVTDKFGPLSFIIKTNIFLNEGRMNEDFVGWGWEDLEFATRISFRHTITTFSKSHGLHLFHPRNIENEKENRVIYNDICNKNGLAKTPTYKKTAVDNEKEMTVDEKGKISISDEVNAIPTEIRDMSVYVSTEVEFPKNKIDLTDLSVVIPVKIDTPDRLHNLQIVLNYFSEWFDGHELIVIEHDPNPQLQELVESHNGIYLCRTSPVCFHKTLNFNVAIGASSNKYIAAYDVDSIFHPNAIKQSLERLKSGETNFIYPYNKYMVQVKKHLFDGLQSLDKDFIESMPYTNCDVVSNKEDFEILYGDFDYACTGGAFFFEKTAFFMAGGYNTGIISYGCEDNEIEVRIKKLGHRIERLQSYNCFHLEHNRSVDSHYNNFFESNHAIFQKVTNMEYDELVRYINNGFRSIDFDLSKNLRIEDTESDYSISIVVPEKFDMSDVDIIIPVYIDFDDRLRNLEVVLNYIEEHLMNYNIIMVEMESNKCKYLYHKKNTEYSNIKEPFNKTKAINIGLEKCTRDIVSVWDVDALIPPQGIWASVGTIRGKWNKIAYPYNGWFLDIDNEVLKNISRTFDFDSIPTYSDEQQHNLTDIEVRFSTRERHTGGGNNGGCVFFDRKTLNELGNYNENFYCWGFEDDEIEQRFEIMGYPRYNHPDSNCYHMVHKRVDDATIHGKEFWKINEAEFKKVISLTPAKLSKYIADDFYSINDSLTIYADPDINLVKAKRYSDNPLVKNLCIKPKIKYAESDVILLAGNHDDSFIRDVITIFNTSRRPLILDGDEVVAFKKSFVDVVETEDYSSFSVFQKSEIIDKPKRSIIYTTYADDVDNTCGFFNKIMEWKDKETEVIVVVHDESALLCALLEMLKLYGTVDKLIYAKTNHGHLKGVQLGVLHSTSDIIMVANNDVRLSQEVIEDCTDQLLSDSKLGIVGWHYDREDHDMTGWTGKTFSFTSRPNKIREYTTDEMDVFKSSKWFTGRVVNAVGDSRMLLCNGSFMCTKKDLWLKYGGMDPNVYEHYFADDYYCYALLDNGYNIENLKKEYRTPTEYFMSTSDDIWKGIKAKQTEDFSTDKVETLIQHTVISYPKEHVVCKIGTNTFPFFYEFKTPTKAKVGERVDILLITEPICDFKLAEDLLSDGGTILCFERYAPEYYKVEGSVAVYRKVGERSEYKLHEKNRLIHNEEVKKNSTSFKNNSKTRFVALTQPRVGFSCLRRLFNYGNDIEIDANIFGESADNSAVSRGIANGRHKDPEKFIKMYFELMNIETRKSAIGFRHGIWDEPDYLLEKYLIKDKDMKKILISRENVLEGMIDCAFAQETGIWHTEHDITDYPDITINVEWAEGWMSSCREVVDGWRKTLVDNNEEFLDISYEDIYRRNKINELYDFLEVERNPDPNFVMKPTLTDAAFKHVANLKEINDTFGEEYGVAGE